MTHGFAAISAGQDALARWAQQHHDFYTLSRALGLGCWV
jgi:hypothetical protein